MFLTKAIFTAIIFCFLNCSNRGLRSIKVDRDRKDSATVPLVEEDKDKLSSPGPSEPSPQLPKTPKPTVEEDDDDGKFFITRALLVIKQLPKSQAKTRREVKARWKVRILMRKSV